MGEPDRARFERSFDALAAIGRRGDGWHRLAWTEEDRQARDWFVAEAEAAGLHVEEDRNANLWAWWGEPGDDAVVTGSHLDTVPGGGAFDGALGLVCGLLAVEELRGRRETPLRPVAVVAWADEEGGRFGTPCLGSGLLTGHYDPADVLARVEGDGTTMAAAAAAAGAGPEAFGPDPQRLGHIGAFVELHVEQGRGLADLAAPVALGTGVWPHGRWRMDAAGEANHAGTTRMADRRDPVQVLAAAARAAREQAEAVGAVATIGRVAVEPGAANGIASTATGWLDARAPSDERLDELVGAWSSDVRAAAVAEGCSASFEREAHSAATSFDPELLERLARILGPMPRLATAAGHDAAMLASAVPSAMLFVRNPTGASHAPAEDATVTDCLEGVRALAVVLEDLAWG